MTAERVVQTMEGSALPANPSGKHEKQLATTKRVWGAVNLVILALTAVYCAFALAQYLEYETVTNIAIEDVPLRAPGNRSGKAASTCSQSSAARNRETMPRSEASLLESLSSLELLSTVLTVWILDSWILLAIAGSLQREPPQVQTPERPRSLPGVAVCYSASRRREPRRTSTHARRKKTIPQKQFNSA